MSELELVLMQKTIHVILDINKKLAENSIEMKKEIAELKQEIARHEARLNCIPNSGGSWMG